MARPKAPGVADIENRFAYHPATPTTGPQHDAVRDLLKKTALTLNKSLPDGRHKALALTHLQEAMWAANAAIACDTVAGAAEAAPEASEDDETPKAAPAKRVAKKTAAKPPAEEPTATVTPIKRVARRATRP